MPSQWETSLQSNTVSHWPGANLESALAMGYLLWEFWRTWIHNNGTALEFASMRLAYRKAISKIKKIFTGSTSFTVVSDVYGSFIPYKTTFIKYCFIQQISKLLGHWISRLLESFEIHWVKLVLHMRGAVITQCPRRQTRGNRLAVCPLHMVGSTAENAIWNRSLDHIIRSLCGCTMCCMS